VSSLRDRLEDAPLPNSSAAQARAWALLADAHRERPRAARRSRRARVLGLALAVVLVAAAVAVAAEPPRWVRHALGEAASSTPRVRSSLGSLPPGRLLVSSAHGTWIVRGDGTRSRLGPWTAATWSPRGLYVAAWRGRELSAVAPNGRVAWTIAARGAVRDATWSPDGYRIAYRRDAALAVVAGDGTGQRVLAEPVRAVTPAWRPGAPHTLAWVGAGGRVEVRDVDTGALVWRSASSVGAVRTLAWSADGRRLLAHGAHSFVVLDVPGTRVSRGNVSAQGARIAAAQWAPSGDRIALALRGPTDTTVLIVRPRHQPRNRVFTTTGTLSSLAWSPDGRRLLVRWAEADQWLLLTPTDPARITAIGGISRRFGAPPTVQDWCCVR
jgi:WD40 repeat protein